MIFELAVLVLVGVFLLLLHKLNIKATRRFIIAFIGVLIFQYFTQALWLNQNLEKWSFLYLDVNWILTVGWAGIIVVSMSLVNLYFPSLKEWSKYIISLLLISIVGFLAEWVVVGLKIRYYSPAVKEVLSGIMLGYGKVPIEALYYIPVFMALITSFVRYWEISFDESASNKKESPKKVTKRKKKR